MKKHLLISFISFNLLLSQANAFTPEEMAQAEKSLLKPHQLKISRPIFLYNEIEAEAQRLHDIAMQKLHEQEMRDLEIQLEIQKEKAINNLCSQGYSKEDAIARINVEGFDVVDFNKKCEAERVRQAEELEAIRAESVRLAEEWAAENARLAEEWAAESARLAEESAAEEAEWAAEEARQKEEHAAEEARWEVERAAEEAQRAEEEARRAEEAARWKAKGDAAKARWEAELAAESAAKQVRTQKVDALMATGMLWLDALQYVDTKPDLDVDALLKQRNEEIAACQRIEALRQMLSEYDFDDCRIDVILNDSEFNPSDLSDLGREKLKVLNHLMHQDHSYNQAIDFVKASNFDAEGFFRAEEEKREAERAEWEAKCAAEEAEEMRQAIETMRTKGLTVEEVNAVLADEDFDPYQYNRHERERLEDELW
ncbi:MAG: hypothetical protein Q8L85_06040, partial [Alphaproteobacteria bacterium]|nr:hypothetical protein [Alphaproteobacteria bacterium]